MGRLITYDNFVQDQLNLIIKKKKIQFGLIVGQCTDPKDYAIRLCPTPKNDEENITQLNKNARKQKSQPSEENDVNFDELWICQHAKQLMRSLPGGFDILGFYVVAPTDQSIKSQAQFRQILFAVYKILGKNKNFKMASNDRILLNICAITSKMTCRTFDISDFKCSATPAEWKLQPGSLRWLRLQCQVAVDIKYPVKKADFGLNLMKQIEKGLWSFLESIEDSLALINGIFRDSDESLDLFSDSKKSKKKQSIENDDKGSSPDFWVEFYSKSEHVNSVKPKIFESMCMMTFKGYVQCRAFVHGKASVQEGISALKQDIIRSILSRCEIHCEDLLLIEEEQKDPYVVHELPRRVFAPLPQDGLTVCDYQFHSDTAADSLDAFREILDLELDEENIDISCEVPPTTRRLIQPEIPEDRLSEFGDTPKHSAMNSIIPVLGVAAAVAAGVASIVYASSSN